MESETNKHGFALIFYVVAALGLVSFASCVAAEFKKSKINDLKLDGKLCYLPGSHAFGLGIAALICLLVVQIISNVIICKQSCFGGQGRNCKTKKSAIASIFLFLSWVSFGVAVILIGVGTSMNKEQPYGRGWLDGDCYIVKDGVFAGSAILVLVVVSSTLVSAIITRRKSQVEQGQKIRAQAE